jgi:hypothetical protein
MTHDEAKKTMCPIIPPIASFWPDGEQRSDRLANCRADGCAWWMEAEPDEGECAIMTIAKGLTTPLILAQKSWSGPDLRPQND